MARSRKAPPNQAKHFLHDDHAHAARREEASQGHAQKIRAETEQSEKRAAKSGRPADTTPRVPAAANNARVKGRRRTISVLIHSTQLISL